MHLISLSLSFMPMLESGSNRLWQPGLAEEHTSVRTLNNCEIIIWMRSFDIYNKWSDQKSIDTHTRAQLRHAILKLTQPCPNKAVVISNVLSHLKSELLLSLGTTLNSAAIAGCMCGMYPELRIQHVCKDCMWYWLLYCTGNILVCLLLFRLLPFRLLLFRLLIIFTCICFYLQ